MSVNPVDTFQIPLAVYDYSNKMNFWSRLRVEFEEIFSSWRVDRVTSTFVLTLFELSHQVTFSDIHQR